MEILDIVDENGIPTGETVERGRAHREGIRHRTAHLWLVRRKNGKIEILLQKRSAEKDSYPGCYDISSAGHIPAGIDYRSSAVRELKEELGIKADEEDLIPCGLRRFFYQNTFHNQPFSDNQVSMVFCLPMDMDEKQFVLQTEEVESVCWIGLEECIQAVEKDSFPNCIRMEELLMLKRTLEKTDIL